MNARAWLLIAILMEIVCVGASAVMWLAWGPDCGVMMFPAIFISAYSIGQTIAYGLVWGWKS